MCIIFDCLLLLFRSLKIKVSRSINTNTTVDEIVLLYFENCTINNPRFSVCNVSVFNFVIINI